MNFTAVLRALAMLAVGLAVSSSLILIRTPDILSLPRLGFWIEAMWWLSGLLGLAVILCQNFVFGVGTALMLAALWFHSYTRLFQPSLSPSVPSLDYVFFDTVSSNYCFSFAQKYLLNIFVPLLAFSSYFAINRDKRSEVLRFLLQILGLAVALNLLVVALQGLWNMDFLAEGSGSAVAAARAPALLEDSGASTIAIAGILVFLFPFLYRSNLSRTKQVLCLGLWLTGAAVGFYTGGRSYFVVVTMGLLIYGLLEIVSIFNRKVGIFSFAALVSLVGLLVVMFRQKFFLGSAFAEAFASDPFWVRIVGWLDPVRGVHTAILWQSIQEYWPQGIGLGGSFIAIAEHAAPYTQKSITVAGDAPLNYYLGFLLETGIAGFFLFLYLVISGGLFIRDYLLKKTRDLADLSMFVLLACLSTTGFVGTQVLHRSYALLFSMSIAYVLWRLSVSNGFAWRRFSFLLLGVSFCSLLGFAGYQYVHPPRVPEFYWSKQGKPQVPHGFSVPIATPEKSHWMSPRVPIAIQAETIRFFVEMPPQFYPLQVSIAIYASTSDEKLQEEHLPPIAYDKASPGKTIAVTLQKSVAEYCSRNYTPESYCFASISTLPEWRPSKDITVGYSLMTPRARE